MNFKNLSIVVTGVYLQSMTKAQSCKDIYSMQLATIGGFLKQYESQSEFLMLGDMQCRPSTPPTNRSSKSNPLSSLLDNFIPEFQLTPVDLTNGTGPSFTYHHHTLPNSSYIDHTLVSPNLLQLVTETKTLEPHYTNTSDHLPVSISLAVSKENTESNNDQNSNGGYIPDYLWNNKAFLSSYNRLVTHSLLSQHIPSNTENTVNLLQETLKKCADEAYSKLKTDKHFHFIPTKRWWNKELTKKRKILQTMFNQWRLEGLPKVSDNISFNRYTFARKDFRIHVRNCKSQETLDHYVNIEKLKNINPKSYC